MEYLKLENVNKIYNYKKKHMAQINALCNVNIAINKGDMIAVLGKSGSGKSTMLHIFGCLDMPTSGDYLIQGINVKNKSDKELARIRNEVFGFVLQDFGLIDHLTVKENVSIPLAFSKKRVKNKKYICDEILKKVNMETMADKQVSMLSGGEKQRVAIARALINDPEVILADEPTGSLDTENGKIVMDIFTMLNSEGKTVVLVTHDNNIADYCSKKIIINDGRIQQCLESCN